MPTKNETIIHAADNYSLALTHFSPDDPNGRVVIINSAMGVPQRFYARYAEFLATQGFHVLTYDYRGISGSLTGKLRGQKMLLSQWGTHDFTAVLDYVAENLPDQMVLVIGHSVGGQILGLTPHHDCIHAHYGVCAQSGYWRGWSGTGQVRMWTLWHVALPVSVALFGYLPAFLLGGGEDVPKGVALEWDRAGKLPNYLYDSYKGADFHHYDAVKTPMRLHSFADDTFAPYKAVAALAQMYPNAPVEHSHIDPSERGLGKVGHFGFFRKQFEPTLWADSAIWLAEV